MKSIYFYLSISFFTSCRLFEISEPIPCPYPEANNNSHQFLIPVIISPHQKTYNVGDTLHINATFRDSMFDYNTKQTFLIQNFPFDVGVKLWRFENDSTWQNGLKVNTYLIDSSNLRRFDSNDDYVGIQYIKFVERNNMYSFEMDIILQKKGRYIFQFEDFINRYPPDYYDEKIEYYTFEGQCDFKKSPVAMVQGDDHMLDFEPELLHIDNNVYRNGYYSIKYKRSNESPYGNGSIAWEMTSTYCFEVK
ncbi:MAG: hypothetical protein WAT79_02250 [Saprospiraceae bacterium]